MPIANTPGAPDFTDALPIGSVLGDYTVKKVLGQGGFGITYLALDAASGKEVVLKENLPAMFALRQQDSYHVTSRGGGEMEENFRWATENFLKEAKLLASLNHPNIVPVLKAFSAIGTAFYVMPWMGGMDLTAYVRKQEGVDGSCLTRLLIPLLHALSYLHGNNLLHRDIKPANILCTDDGTPILIDFGTARAMVSERSQTVVESAGFTPIEQMQSHGNTGPWTDLYALGATCYRLITGEAPPRSSDRVGEEDAYHPLAKREELMKLFSPVLLGSIDKALGLWPKHRWQSADEWKAILTPTQGSKKKESFPWLWRACPIFAFSRSCGSLSSNKSHPTVQRAKNSIGRKLCLKYIVIGGLLLLGIGWGCFEFGSPSADALYHRGLQYARGNGVVRNEKEAVKLFRKAAKKGHSNAQYELGNCYYHGVGVRKNMQIAAVWYRKAADQGNYWAQFALRTCDKSDIGLAKEQQQGPEQVQPQGPEQVQPQEPEQEGDPKVYARAAGQGYISDKKTQAASQDVAKQASFAPHKSTDSAWRGKPTKTSQTETVSQKADCQQQTSEHENYEQILMHEYGINISNVKGKDGDKALLNAIAEGRTEHVDILLKAGANVNARETEHGMTALIFACYKGFSKIAQKLIEAGAEVNSMDQWGGGTALIFASYSCDEDTMKMLINYGAEVSQGNYDSWTPLMVAAEKGYANRARILIDAGADVNTICRDARRTALREACRRGSIDIARMLVEAGANVNVEDKDGWTPLMHACDNGCNDIVKVLIAHEAIVDTKNIKGQTAVDIAKAKGRKDILQTISK